jgi:hypothetical protein
MKLSLIPLLLLLILVACDNRHDLPSFTTEGDRGEPESTRLLSDEPGVYRLKDPLLVVSTPQAFYLRFRGGDGNNPTLTVLGTDNRQLAAKVLPNADEASVYLPLQRGETIEGFRIEPSSVSGEATGTTVPDTVTEGFEILEVGITAAISGFKCSGWHLTLGTSVQHLHRDGNSVKLVLSPPEDWPIRQPDGSSVASSADGKTAGKQNMRTVSVEAEEMSWQISIVLATRAPLPYADFRQGESAAYSGEASAPPANTAIPVARRASVLIRLSSGDNTVSYKHTALAGQHSLFLYHGLVPFIPEAVQIEPLGGAAALLESFEIACLPVGTEAADMVVVESPGGGSPDEEPSGAAITPGSTDADMVVQPLPADPGGVLLYDPSAWRRPRYELFSWSRFPEILIMDTASYQVQSRFFKRLAFFVEKKGYRGRLVSNEEFADLHGFNAHDYRAKDLARFFQAARDQLFALNPEEELLKQILLDNGIIRDDGVISAGRGAILSISRSSYPILRRHLLTHECCHGLFFSLPDFRQASFAAWNELSAPEQEYWKLFFRWVGYDTEDQYLTVNEYQAYLFQQPRPGVEYYFAVLTPSRLIQSYPEQAEWVRELIRSDPNRFTKAFDNLEPSLLQIAGLEGGRLVELDIAEF